MVSYRTLAQIIMDNPGNRDIIDIIYNLINPAGGGGGGGSGVKHYNLSYLNWSQAAHTFDCDLDIGGYDFKGGDAYLSDLTTNTIVYAAATGKLTSIAINATATNKFLRQVSGGVPSFEIPYSVDIYDSQTIPAPTLEVRLDRNFLDGNYYYEPTYSSGLLTAEDWYTDSGKGTKKREITYSYS